MTRTIVPDESQKKVIEAGKGRHLVLASPGCGKTQILTERIGKALREGVSPEKMLCLTFTNRAAKGMLERIEQNIVHKDLNRLFVGNVHRFCSKLLFDKGLVPPDSTIIDDEEMRSILAQYTQEDEEAVNKNVHRRKFYNQTMQLAHYLRQAIEGHEKTIRIHPECFAKEDAQALMALCRQRNMAFDAQALKDMLEHADTYLDSLDHFFSEISMKNEVYTVLKRMQLARYYELYKEKHHLLDFEDLLIRSYDYLSKQTGQYAQYDWVQVDEVQDLNPLQLSIIDLLTTEDATVMYLGDGQQAIFSFMGAKTETLELLRQRCGENIYHLSTNHRSPKYLLDMFNAYAGLNLGIAPELLPRARREQDVPEHACTILHSDTVETEYEDVAQTVQTLRSKYPTESVAVIVNSNDDAQKMSHALKMQHIGHFKISGEDLMTRKEVKALFAHIELLRNDLNDMAWARLLQGLKIMRTSGSSRKLVQRMRKVGMCPSCCLYDTGTYLERFYKACMEEDMVVFDTETTGLNVFEDDILQIAAVKIRKGTVVSESNWCVHIQSDREIPAMLGDLVNPIIEERKKHKLLPPQEALQNFLNYAQGCVLVAHNANFDLSILRSNVERHLSKDAAAAIPDICLDSLKIIRLLRPDLKSFKLKNLLEALHLEGNNSHLADDDVQATCSLLRFCMEKTQEILPLQRQLLQNPNILEIIRVLRLRYQRFFLHGKNILYDRTQSAEPILVEELHSFARYFVQDRIFDPLDDFSHVLRYLSQELIEVSSTPSLIEQIEKHGLELQTMKEADLCGAKSMTEKVFVSTIHKAKGLEYDNVIVFDAVDGRFPNFYTKNNEKIRKEDARKLYVGITRARKRVIIAVGDTRIDYTGSIHPRPISPFLLPILSFFS